MTDRAREIAHRHTTDCEHYARAGQIHCDTCNALTADIVRYGEEILSSRLKVTFAAPPITTVEVSDFVYTKMAEGDD